MGGVPAARSACAQVRLFSQRYLDLHLKGYAAQLSHGNEDLCFTSLKGASWRETAAPSTASMGLKVLALCMEGCMQKAPQSRKCRTQRTYQDTGRAHEHGERHLQLDVASLLQHHLCVECKSTTAPEARCAHIHFRVRLRRLDLVRLVHDRAAAADVLPRAPRVPVCAAPPEFTGAKSLARDLMLNTLAAGSKDKQTVIAYDLVTCLEPFL